MERSAKFWNPYLAGIALVERDRETPSRPAVEQLKTEARTKPNLYFLV